MSSKGLLLTSYTPPNRNSVVDINAYSMPSSALSSFIGFNDDISSLEGWPKSAIPLSKDQQTTLNKLTERKDSSWDSLCHDQELDPSMLQYLAFSRPQTPQESPNMENHNSFSQSQGIPKGILCQIQEPTPFASVHATPSASQKPSPLVSSKRSPSSSQNHDPNLAHTPYNIIHVNPHLQSTHYYYNNSDPYKLISASVPHYHGMFSSDPNSKSNDPNLENKYPNISSNINHETPSHHPSSSYLNSMNHCTANANTTYLPSFQPLKLNTLFPNNPNPFLIQYPHQLFPINSSTPSTTSPIKYSLNTTSVCTPHLSSSPATTMITIPPNSAMAATSTVPTSTLTVSGSLPSTPLIPSLFTIPSFSQPLDVDDHQIANHVMESMPNNPSLYNFKREDCRKISMQDFEYQVLSFLEKEIQEGKDFSQTSKKLKKTHNQGENTYDNDDTDEEVISTIHQNYNSTSSSLSSSVFNINISSETRIRKTRKHHVIRLKIPCVDRKKLNLWALFFAVQEFGGYQMCTAHRKWKKVAILLHLPKSMTSASSTLKTFYEKFLKSYETKVWLNQQKT